MTPSRADAPTRHPRHQRRGEPRLPAVLATLVAVGLYVALPQQLLLAPRYILPALELLLLIPLVAFNPRRLTRQTRTTRTLSLTLVFVIAASNLVALGLLVHDLVSAGTEDGKSLLLAALQVWLTNVIVFGLAFWELDRGGPVSRTQAPRAALPLADFRFSQDENHDAVEEVADGASVKSDWVPTLVDYLYVSVTNSTAFSPTDTMPLSSRMKLLMAVESVSALVTSLLVVARAVSVLH
ncbi:Uncharacterized membrane protein [Streptomyces sp. DvalAA-14]|uniref:DUF1345 domain-containing protein n=1 Tax=unclassified Streptomyces TaxID=2593676 RepID=UPI00081B0706|nr:MULTISPECIES: DUF1345 domain-containing protein [unclassified Streptomyces]MYS24076.1 DUF1345 domain-containing protein [Streptomyces sp. SID4948]SCE42365.1 Uncharacterized membrane protein [Streptomyces sp. DvalAA-14]